MAMITHVVLLLLLLVGPIAVHAATRCGIIVAATATAADRILLGQTLDKTLGRLQKTLREASDFGGTKGLQKSRQRFNVLEPRKGKVFRKFRKEGNIPRLF